MYHLHVWPRCFQIAASVPGLRKRETWVSDSPLALPDCKSCWFSKPDFWGAPLPSAGAQAGAQSSCSSGGPLRLGYPSHLCTSQKVGGRLCPDYTESLPLVIIAVRLLYICCCRISILLVCRWLWDTDVLHVLKFWCQWEKVSSESSDSIILNPKLRPSFLNANWACLWNVVPCSWYTQKF